MNAQAHHASTMKLLCISLSQELFSLWSIVVKYFNITGFIPIVIPSAGGLYQHSTIGVTIVNSFITTVFNLLQLKLTIIDDQERYCI